MQVRPAGTGGHPDADTCDERDDAAGVGDGADAPDPTTSTSLQASHELAPASWIRRHQRTIAAHVVTALVTAFVIRVVGSGFGAGYPPVFPDSFSFTDVARRGPLTGRFWFDERPIGFPLLFWAVGRSVRFVVLAQIALYVTAFGAVVAVALRTLRSRAAQLFVTVLTVAIAMQPRFVLWTTHVLSESLAITTGVAALAAWWWFAAAPTRRRAVVALVVTGAFVVARDSNVVVVALSVLPVLAVIGWRRRRADPAVARTLVAGAVLGVVLCGYVTVSQDVSDRNIYPVLNNVGERILPDADMTAWFEGNGMPLDDTLRAATGDNAFDDGSAMLQAPAFAELREWASGPGQRAQLWSYVRHAPFWSDLLGERLDELLGYDYDDYDAFAVGERLWSPALDGPRSSAQLLVWVAGAGLALTLAASRPRLRLALIRNG